MSESTAHLDLDDLTRTLRRRALPILGFALVAGLVTAGAIAGLGKEHAVATLGVASVELDEKKALPYGDDKLPRLVYSRGIAPPEFKTLAPRFDSPAFADFVMRREGVEPELARRVTRELSIENRRRELIAPVFGSTRSDLRELGESAKPSDNLVLGVRIGYAARDSELAKRVVALAAEFVAETVFHATVGEIVMTRAREHDANRLVSQNILINTRFAIGQLEARARTFERMRVANPELGKGTPQQVVSVAESGYRYLTPSAQLVGIESSLAELRERIQSAERQARKAAAQSEYYKRAEALLSARPRSDPFIAELRSHIATVFPEGPDPDGAIAEGRNEALLDLVHIAALRNQGLRFLADPVLDERDPMTYVAAGLGAAVVAILGGLGLVLTSVWLRSGRTGAAR
jgi:hypothetical protein